MAQVNMAALRRNNLFWSIKASSLASLRRALLG
jgi:hypothetical protein